MKIRYKYIHFVEQKDVFDNKRYRCLTNKTSDCLLEVEFFYKWKQWVMTNINPTAIFSSDCLADIADFLNQLNKQRNP